MMAGRAPVIDFHAHMLEPAAFAHGARHSPATGFGTQTPNEDPGTAAARSRDSIRDPGRHVDAMDRLAIDAEVLASTAVMQGTSWAHPDLERDLVRGINDEIAAWHRQHPTRFLPSCVLPLGDRTLTTNELRHRAQDGFRVVLLPAAVRGVYLGQPDFRYLWELIRELDLTVFLHPDGIRDPWFVNYALWNSIGQGIEETKAIASLIYEGVLEDLPGLKIVIAHGGGFLPHYTGRLDRNILAWPDSTRNITRAPSDYLADLYFDTCLYDPRILDALVHHYGADRLVLGSDFPIGDPDPIGFVDGNESLDQAQRRAILGGTAARLLGLRTAAADTLGVAAADRGGPAPGE